MVRNNGKKRIDIIKNPYLSPILVYLAKKPLTCSMLSKKIGKPTSTIFVQLKVLISREENYVKKINNNYELNFNKIIEEFYKYIYSLNSILILNTGNKKVRKKISISKEIFFEDLKNYKENIIIKKLFEKLLIYYSYDFEKYISLTIEDTFNELIQLILLLKTKEINFFLKDFKDKNDKLIFNDFIDNIKFNIISFERATMKLELGFVESCRANIKYKKCKN